MASWQPQVWYLENGMANRQPNMCCLEHGLDTWQPNTCRTCFTDSPLDFNQDRLIGGHNIGIC